MSRRNPHWQQPGDLLYRKPDAVESHNGAQYVRDLFEFISDDHSNECECHEDDFPFGRAMARWTAEKGWVG